MWRSVAMNLILLAHAANALVNDCTKWDMMTSYRSCCSCPITDDLVCFQSCPSGYYKVGEFSVEIGEPSQCLIKINGRSGRPLTIIRRPNSLGHLCSRCHRMCRDCDGPTDQHCKECSSKSFKVVNHKGEFGNRARDDDHRIVSSRLLLPDGNVVHFKKGVIREVRDKREASIGNGSDDGDPVVIGQSMSWVSENGTAVAISWNVGPRRQRKPDIPSARPRLFKNGIGRWRNRKRRFTGSVIRPKPMPSTDSDVTPENNTATTAPPTTSIKDTETEPEMVSTTRMTPQSTATESVTSRTIKAQSTTTESVTSRTIKAQSTTTESVTSRTTNTPPTTTTTTKTTTASSIPTTPRPFHPGSIFSRYRSAEDEKATWFRCMYSCPGETYVVRETKCECHKDECTSLDRKCYVINVHNVCVQTCQPGFVKHQGLKECLCPGPVVNHTCTQPVEVTTSGQPRIADETVSMDMYVALPIVSCLLVICCLLLILIFRRRWCNDGAEPTDEVRYWCTNSIMCCCLGRCHKMGQDGADEKAQLPDNNDGVKKYVRELPGQNKDINEGTLGRVVWKFDDHIQNRAPAKLPSEETTGNQRRWRLPTFWSISTPPSIPKKNHNTKLSRVQAFLSRYTPDLYGNNNKETTGAIYKEPPPTPKSDKSFRVQPAIPNDPVVIRPQELVSEDVIQSWLHSSFHVQRPQANHVIRNRPPINVPNDVPEQVRPKRKIRPVSNCYESIEGSIASEEAIYESLSEEEESLSSTNPRSSYYYSSVEDRSIPKRPVYANMEETPQYRNTSSDCMANEGY